MLYKAMKIHPLRSDRRGATAIEYGLIATVMSVLLVTIFTALGAGFKVAFDAIAQTFVTGQ